MKSKDVGPEYVPSRTASQLHSVARKPNTRKASRKTGVLKIRIGCNLTPRGETIPAKTVTEGKATWSPGKESRHPLLLLSVSLR
jgi:hypothetical protein